MDVSLPITGMTCAACAGRIEKVLGRLPGVSAQVNLATERAQVVLAEGATLNEVTAAINKAGYGVAHETQALALQGMTCAACAARIEKVLNRLPGVTATVNLASETAQISQPAGLHSTEQLINAVRKAGYAATPLDAAANGPAHSGASMWVWLLPAVVYFAAVAGYGRHAAGPASI